MLKDIKKFFSENLDPESSTDTKHTIEYATAALLIELAKADFEEDQVERTLIIAMLRDTFDLSQKEIDEAAQFSFANEFIEKLPNKYETLIGEDGVRLSGGEKQRISIARAMLKKSSIILLDEATSSLDSETEEKIQKALDKLTLNKTTVVIAHRLSTILNSDNIYVMEKGMVMDSGNHEELLTKSDTYKNYYNKQINKS